MAKTEREKGHPERKREPDERRRHDDDEPLTLADLDELELADWSEAFALFGLATAETRDDDGERRGADTFVLAGLTEWLKDRGASTAKNKFLEWWLAYLEAMSAYEMLDGWITSPFRAADDDDVRIKVRDQIAALTKKAKEKLVDRLKKRAKDLREKARKLRNEGKTEQADRVEKQAHHFGLGRRRTGARRSAVARFRQATRPYRSAARARARAASTSRSRGCAFVTSESSSRRVAAATSSTARSNAAAFAWDGFACPVTFRTYCSAAARTSFSVAGGSKLCNTRMFRHIRLAPPGAPGAPGAGL